MRRNSNYFGDVSKFFLKAKKQEDIELNPEVKNQIRETLASKIKLLKQKVMDEETIETPAPKMGFFMEFFTKWRSQLIGVPISLFALMLIVFAANNYHFTTNDLSKTSLLETTKEQPQEDSPNLENLEIADLPVEQPKPGLLVLNINDLGNEDTQRSLNKTTISQITSTNKPTTTTKAETLNNPVSQTTNTTTQLTGGGETNLDSNLDATQNSENTTQPVENTKTTPTSTTTNTPNLTVSSPVIESNKIEPVITSDINTIDSTKIVEPIQTPAATTADNVVVSEASSSTALINPEIATSQLSLSAQMARNNVLLQKIRTKEYVISYFGNTSYKETATFDSNIIEKLTATNAASEVNIYYIDGTHVIVEIKNDLSKKLYSYEKRGDSWTAVKYEKL